MGGEQGPGGGHGFGEIAFESADGIAEDAEPRERVRRPFFRVAMEDGKAEGIQDSDSFFPEGRRYNQREKGLAPGTERAVRPRRRDARGICRESAIFCVFPNGNG